MKRVLLVVSLLFSFIVFSQNKLEAKKEIKPSKENFTFNIKKGNKVFWVVNEKPVSKKVVESINPDHIKSIKIYKGSEAIELYGEKAKDGVVVIVMKTKRELLENKKKQKK